MVTRLRGVWKPRLSILGEMISPWQHWQNYRAAAFIISYPKTGRTWLRMLIKSALEIHTGITCSDPLETHEISDRDPRVPRLRVIHDDEPHWKRPDQLRRNKSKYRNKRVVLLVRDPRDTMVSLYLQMTKRWKVFKPEWKDIDTFIWQERGALRSMIAYYNIWAQSRSLPGALMLVRYEDIHADPPATLDRVLTFLGVTGVHVETLHAAVEANTIARVRAKEQAGVFASKRLRPGIAGDPESFKARRGEVGGYLQYLTHEQAARIAAYTTSHLDPWYGYGDLG